MREITMATEVNQFRTGPLTPLEQSSAARPAVDPFPILHGMMNAR
jgi:hypothetical protein